MSIESRLKGLARQRAFESRFIQMERRSFELDTYDSNLPEDDLFAKVHKKGDRYENKSVSPKATITGIPVYDILFLNKRHYEQDLEKREKAIEGEARLPIGERLLFGLGEAVDRGASFARDVFLNVADTIRDRSY